MATTRFERATGRVILLVLPLLACPALGRAATPTLATCEATELAAAAGAAARIVKCHARAARTGAPVAPTCLDAAHAKLARSFARAESGPCPAHGETAAVVGVLDTLGAELVTVAGGGTARCDERKLLAAAKRAQATLKAQAAHAKAPERDGVSGAVAKAALDFANRAITAEAAGDCTIPGNAKAVAARTDTGSADVVDLVRGTLRGLAAARGRTIGAAVRANVLAATNEDAYRTTLVRQVSVVTPEYELMWGNIEPNRGTLLTAPVDAVMTFGQQHGLRLTGAPLVWHLILPPWVNDAMTPAELQTAVDERIDELVGGYAGVVEAWNVVNEAVVDFGATLRDSLFLQKLGPDYIRNAFLRARAADPSALLFYNDFLADGMNVKSDYIYALVTSLLAQGTPIDGVSFQMHLGGIFGPPPSRESIRENLARFAALGLVVRISEMDVEIHDLPGSRADQLARQRAIYHDVVAACLDVPGCDSIAFWGISDRHTWIDDYLGIHDRPLPFDDFYGTKAAFFGIRDALLGD